MTLKEEIFGGKECPFCGTIDDHHHSAECVDTGGKGYTTQKTERSEGPVERVVSSKTLIIVQGYNELGRRWEDIRPPYDEAESKRMPCNTVAEAKEIVALYDDSLTECGFGRMRIIKRTKTDSLVSC